MTVNNSSKYPKRLIEVDLPIKKISEHARREKSIHHGHISTLHIWWARRPLAACRAVICAALWPDPADPLCPKRFRTEAEDLMRKFWNPMGLTDRDFSDPILLRQALLDFIADFSNWDNSTDEQFLSAARKLTQIAHESLSGEMGARPLLLDPFAGGGAIPLEALRIGVDAYASDLNPVAVLLNKVILEYIPRFGQELADDLRKSGKWVKEEAEKELGDYYPKDPDGATPIAYLWARTIRCEGPGCGAEIPLIGNFWLSRTKFPKYALILDLNKESKKIGIRIEKNPDSAKVNPGLTKGNKATCPICGYVTPTKRVKTQLLQKKGGSNNSKLYAIILSKGHGEGFIYRTSLPSDEQNAIKTQEKLSNYFEVKLPKKGISLIPDELCPPIGALGYRFQPYGIEYWRDLYTPRQLLALTEFTSIVSSNNLREKLIRNFGIEKSNIIQILLSLAIGRLNDRCCTLCRWRPDYLKIEAANGGENKMPMHLDFVESNPFGGRSGDWAGNVEWIAEVIEHVSNSGITHQGIADLGPAQKQILPNDSADAFITDPPYYGAFGYSDLSEFFYIWLRRSVPFDIFQLFNKQKPPKNEEAIVIEKELPDGRDLKDHDNYIKSMRLSFENGRKTVKHNGVATIVFASKDTVAWEAILEALISSGWIITGSWPLDTEMAHRTRAIGSAALNSSIHIFCRPRENPDGSLREEIGDWRDILAELPGRIHDWMPRLAKEGVVGADALFACLGPALEIYSRYSRVEKASGDEVPLREYLEHVWAAVSREALGMIFEGADATGFEEDARITAMWLWTLKTAESPALNGKNGNGIKEQQEESEEEEGEEAEGSGKKKVKGFSLEYDAARKIAQGLGAHLEEMHTLVEIKKGNARLLPVSERAAYLLKSEKEKPIRRPKKKEKQSTLFPLEMEGSETPEEDFGDVAEIGKTTLDKVHQSMLLFAAGQSDALKRFLVDEGIGKNAQFWTLAQALAALYPTGTEEKRWVEGVLARKKGLGL